MFHLLLITKVKFKHTSGDSLYSIRFDAVIPRHSLPLIRKDNFDPKPLQAFLPLVTWTEAC
jgi:hypothetical protein